MGNFFEVKDIRRFIFDSNNWKDFKEILKHESKKTKGNAFELLSMCYLKTDPFYGSIFKYIFHESEVSTEIKVEKLKLAENDIGVDLIGLDFDGDYWAIQCKYRSLSTRNLRLNDRLAEFFTMTGGQTLKKELKNRILISTTNDISHKIKDNIKEFSQILNNEFTKLDTDEFCKFKEYLNERYKELKIKKVLRKPEYQQKAIKNVVREFKKEDKGQLIMACGSGKTLTALQIKEKMKTKKTLYLLPSLNLINQTIKEWVSFSGLYFKPLCVCSDPSSSRVIENKDRWIFSKQDIGIPVLNSPEKIHRYLKSENNYVIFCTYQSSSLISQSQNNGLLQEFDITFCDEAHNCAGNGFKRSGLILDETEIKSKKRLFMTATPLNIDQKIKEKAYEKNIEISSMDDTEKFGKVFHTLSFREAVAEEILVPYKIIFQDIKKSESEVIEKIVKRKLVKIPEIEYIDAESVACDIAIVKGMKQYGIRKLITFHRLVRFAEYFSKTFNYVWNWMDKKDKTFFSPECFWLSGEEHTQQQRQRILDRFKNLKKGKSLIVSNSQCLSEGVNVPSLDAICFVDPKRSTTDIIQSVGRVMRRSEGKLTGYIIIPLFINDIDQIDDELDKTRYKYIWEIIKALMLHDEYLSETIKKLRIELGQRKKSTRDNKGLELPKEIVISEDLKNTFAEDIEITLIQGLTEDWYETYGTLKQFLHDNDGRQPERKDGIKLYNWCSFQRTCKRKNHKWLTQERIKLLDELIPLGWSWEVLEDEFKKKCLEIEKELDSPRTFELSNLPSGLQSWISKQIKIYDDLSQERKNLLTNLQKKGLRLQSKTIFAQDEWVSSIEKFYADNGHLVIPKDSEFGNIADMVRQGYKSNSLNTDTLKKLKKLEDFGWMWDPSIETSLEKIKFLSKWCIKNNSFNPPEDLFIEGNNKTYVNTTKKEESEKRKFNLYSLIYQLRARYKYTKYQSNPLYEKEFINQKNNQMRKITKEEITALESIKIKDGYWYWEIFDGYLRVYKKCISENISIKQKTRVDFDLERFRNIGRWIQTVKTSNKNQKLERYNYDKLLDLPGDHFRDMEFNERKN